jgi:precorrin-2 dehydrogenase/sirohydrochlorin ferrochelatase
MIPLALDPKFVKLAVAGNGALALRRLRALRAAGAEEVVVYADAPEAALADEAGDLLRLHMPGAAEIGALHALWIVDVAEDVGAGLAGLARGLTVLVNFEDRPEFCDFHSVAEVRRGDLLVTVSTGGAAPGLAGSIRRRLEGCFGPEWDGRVARVKALRGEWRAEGVKMPEAARRIEALVAEGCWLNCPTEDASGSN